MNESSPIPYFQVVNDTIATSGQPEPEHFSWLQQQGFGAVINLSPSNTRNYFANEGKASADGGMMYMHLPIDCSILTPEQYQAFAHLMDAVQLMTKGKILVHCGMNIKSSGFMHPYRILRLGQRPDFALAELLKTPEHEPKWFAYYEKLGLPS